MNGEVKVYLVEAPSERITEKGLPNGWYWTLGDGRLRGPYQTPDDAQTNAMKGLRSASIIMLL
jgi:hypothetical protein